MGAGVVSARVVQRSIQLNVTEFAEAQELPLKVRLDEDSGLRSPGERLTGSAPGSLPSIPTSTD